MRPSRSSQRNNVESDQPSWQEERATWREAKREECRLGNEDKDNQDNDSDAGGPTFTAGAHWEESLFGTDLMSGYLTAGTQPELSQLSIASLEDMGYDTIFDYDSFMA